MNKRILSVVLALALCFTLCATSFADVVLMDGAQNTVRERGWEFQAAQKEAMENNESAFAENELSQIDVLSAAYDEYQTIRDGYVKEQAQAAAAELLGSGALDYYKNNHVFDFVRWYTMRQIYEGKLDVTINDEAGEYEAWLKRFSEFEAESDTKVSAETPAQSLDQLGPYSEELTQYYIDLMEIYAANPDKLEGTDAEKFKTYAEVEKMLIDIGGEANLTNDVALPEGFKGYLEEDAKAVTTEALLELADIVIDFVTFNTQEHDDAIPGGPDKTPFQRISARSLKAALLIAGEELARDLVYDVPDLWEDAKNMPKDEVVETFLASGVPKVMSGNNTEAVDTMYTAAVDAAELASKQTFTTEIQQALEDGTGLTVKEHANTFINTYIKSVMGKIEVNHGVELVHFNTYIGRAILSPAAGSTIEIKSEKGVIDFGFKHDRYPAVDKALKKLGDKYEQIDAVSDNPNIVIEETDDIGVINYDATKAKTGETATIKLYRGYHIDGTDVKDDVYRYIGSYKVTVDNGDKPTEPEEYTITLKDITDKKLGETITITGVTNLPNITVTITKNGEPIYISSYTGKEFMEGIIMQLPYGAKVGDEYLVSVGARGAEASDTFKIIGDEEPPTTPTEPEGEYKITIEPIADKQLGETIKIKGTTNIPFVTVSIKRTVPAPEPDGTDNGMVYLSAFSKAEYEKGITMQLPYGAKVGYEYLVSAGARGVDTSTSFKIVETVTPPVGKNYEMKVSGEKDSDKGVVHKSVTLNSTLNIPITVSVKDGNIEESDNVEIEWTQVSGKEYVELVETTSTQNLVKNNNLRVKGLKIGANVATFEAQLKANGTIVAGAVKTVIVSVTRGGGGGGGGRPQPTQPATTPVEQHKCEWPDIVGHWAHETIDTMTVNGYIHGYDDGTFKPNNSITRAEFSAIVYRILGLHLAEDGVEYDDTVGHWAEGIIATMSLPEGYGMLRGYGDGNFGPQDLITREQAIAIIARAKSSVWNAATEGAKDVFTDAEDISWWFDGEFDSAVTNGLVEGYEDGSVKPLQHTTRAEACVLLARAWPEVLTQKSTAQE